ncbi:MAG: SpoIIE family protein phosphatase [bacterium]|nr:SpoIIE family protein phosphatase [bacterium]
MEKINLENKYFKIEFKHNLITTLVLSSLVLLLFMGFVWYTFFYYQKQFDNTYKSLWVRNFQKQLTEINNSAEENKKERINELARQQVKEKYIISIWVTDKENQVVAATSEKPSAPEQSLLNHLWQFTPDGEVMPFQLSKKENDYSETFFPVYNAQKTIDYVAGIRMTRGFGRLIYIPKLSLYINLTYILVISLGLFLLLLVNLLTIFLALSFNKRNSFLKKELLNQLYNYHLDTLPFRFEFEEGKFKNNFIADFMKYLNHLLEEFNRKSSEKQALSDRIKQVIPPLLYQASDRKEEIKVIVKADNTELSSYIWDLYFREHGIRNTEPFSAGLYHYYKEKDSDIIFKFIDIERNTKAFFGAKILEADVNKKIVLLAMLNHILNNHKEHLDQADGFLATVNSLINRMGQGDFLLHAFYCVLNRETGYVEVASTHFTPLILYKAGASEFSFYSFNSMPLGQRMNDEFLKELKKESFRLSPQDILLLCDNNVENLFSLDNAKFETYTLTEIIKENAAASAEVITDKIKEKLTLFSADFSRVKDLFMLMIKQS